MTEAIYPGLSGYHLPKNIELEPSSWPIQAIWYGEEPGNDLTSLLLDIPMTTVNSHVYLRASLGATLRENEEGNNVFVTDTLSVPIQYTGLGLGERLVRALAFIGTQKGCESIRTEFSHPASIKHFMKVFGSERIHFLESSSTAGIDMGVDEAISVVTSRRLGATVIFDGNQTVILSRMVGIEAEADLRGLDTTGLDIPLVQSFQTIEDYWRTEKEKISE
jgi:hypothetical protein